MARLTLRLDFGPGRAIGHGKIRLLEAVRDYGSISAAGRSMGMSYRRAWLLIDELNGLFDEPVIETKHGGPGGGGAELTPFGHRVVQQYRSIETKAHIAVADEEGQAAALMLPAECLRALIMTLPDMMRRALRLQHGDPSLRLVYPVASWEIERSARPEIRIVTLRTSDGFHVSFAMTTRDLREMVLPTK